MALFICGRAIGSQKQGKGGKKEGVSLILRDKRREKRSLYR